MQCTTVDLGLTRLDCFAEKSGMEFSEALKKYANFVTSPLHPEASFDGRQKQQKKKWLQSKFGCSENVLSPGRTDNNKQVGYLK